MTNQAALGAGTAHPVAAFDLGPPDPALAPERGDADAPAAVAEAINGDRGLHPLNRPLGVVSAQSPLCEPGVPANDASGPGEAPPPVRILVVDDDVIALQALRVALANLGAALYFAQDGESALRMARDLQPNLLLLDIHLPGIDGLEICRRLQAEQVWPMASVLFVTRHADAEMEARALDCGATDFIAKPFTPAVLQARVRNTLRLQRHAEQARQAESAHWQRFAVHQLAQYVANAQEAVLVADAAGQVVMANLNAGQLYSSTVANLTGQDLRQLLHRTGIELVLPSDGTRASVLRRRVMVGAWPGPRQPYEVSFSCSGQGPNRLCTVIARDLCSSELADEAMRERQATEQASRAKSLMMSYIAHEIGNPLNGILGFTELMIGDRANPLPPKQQRRLNEVAKAGQQLRALMRDVVDLNGVDSGHFVVNLEAVDVAALARQMLDLAVVQAEAAQVTLCFDAAHRTWWVHADPLRLQQVLANLVSNAIKYNRVGGQVVIDLAREADGQVRIDVADNGLGMSAEQTAHLFEPFNRLGRAGMAPGCGLGLALVHKLVSAMGGCIRVDSTAGQGTRVSLLLSGAAPSPMAAERAE